MLKGKRPTPDKAIFIFTGVVYLEQTITNLFGVPSVPFMDKIQEPEGWVGGGW